MKKTRIIDQNPSLLLLALRHCTVPEQHDWARRAGTKRNYLYQLAAGGRVSPRLELAKGICDASVQMHVASGGRIPKITLEQLAEMCEGREDPEAVR